jgi:hypothetical protein
MPQLWHFFASYGNVFIIIVPLLFYCFYFIPLSFICGLFNDAINLTGLYIECWTIVWLMDNELDRTSWPGCKHCCFVFGRSRVLTSVRRSAILTEVYHRLPQSLQANAGILPQIRPRLFPSKSFPIIHPSFDGTVWVTEKPSLHKQVTMNWKGVGRMKWPGLHLEFYYEIRL